MKPGEMKARPDLTRSLSHPDPPALAQRPMARVSTLLPKVPAPHGTFPGQQAVRRETLVGHLFLGVSAVLESSSEGKAKMN